METLDKKVFLICSEDGWVIDIIESKSFEKAYEATIARNNGEILIELDEQTIEKLKKILG